jgi:hypothetical protein
MARVLISEPHDASRRLLELMVALLGHEPVVVDTPAPEYLKGIDVFMVEPAASLGAVLAKAAYISDGSLPIVCVSADAPPQIDIPFAAVLGKPVTLGQLRATIDLALAWGAFSCRRDVCDRAA